MDEEDDRILRKYEGPVDELEEYKPQFRSAARQAGKDWHRTLREVLKGSVRDMATMEYTLADGTRISDAALRRMDAGALQSLLNQVALATHRPNRQPMTMPNLGVDVTNGTIVTWKSRGIFTYAAVKAGDSWYITGKGEFYGKNQFAHGEFCNSVLASAEVTGIQIVVDLLPLVLD